LNEESTVSRGPALAERQWHHAAWNRWLLARWRADMAICRAATILAAMARVVLTIVAVTGGLWLLLELQVLPAPLVRPASLVVGGVCSLSLPLFLLSLYAAPGLYRDMHDGLRRTWERVAGRRREIDDLQRKIAHLNHPHHMTQLGQIYYRQGRLGKAAELFQQTVGRDPDALEARYRLALCHFDQGRYGPAAELLEQVHAVKPEYDYGMAYLRLAEAQHRLGHTERAAEVYGTLLKFYPSHPEGSYQFALLRAERGELADARRLMGDVVFAVRHSPSFHRRRNRHWMLKARWWLWRNRG
jgi:tetratricopeptide (TPR) repeat protein